jgi:phage tail sheath gpL-like
MSLGVNSKAAAVGVGVDNVVFQPAAQNVPRKILIIATYDPAKTLVVDEVPVQVTSPEDVGDQFGFGFMAHRLSEKAFAGGQGIETWIQPQAEPGGGVQATGDIDYAGASGVKAGTIYLYIAGDKVEVEIADADTADDLATKTVAAINADTTLPVTAVVNGVTTSQVDLTANTSGTYGNDISIAFNLAGESYPTGVVAPSITPMASGAGTPTISDALDGLGTGDDANEDFFTDVVHGYLQDTTTLDAIETYVGSGDTFDGLYAKTVSRPFRVLTGDVAAGSAGLTALQAVADARKTDRANGIIAVPDSESHPSEIAALAIGNMARINQDRAAQHYVDIRLDGVWPGDKGSDRWTSDYDNRDTAVKGGISPTKVKSGEVYLQNVITMYRPDNVPEDSNGYREMANISKLQNMMYTMRQLFENEKWQGISIVEDIAQVTSTVDREKARDIDSVKDDLVALYRAWASKAWIADSQFSIDALKESGSVEVRSGGDGFTITTKAILSGVANIYDNTIQFDTSFAVLN